MPLILLCGLPCSGKTTLALKLEEKIGALGLETLVISEQTLALDRNAAYDDNVSEKKTRGALKSAVERSLRGEIVVILDSLNNIKGYRYELWCIAKAAKTRYCCVHSDVSASQCRIWNEARIDAERYSNKVFEDLAGRLEVPDTRNRWDTPLFRIRPSSDIKEDIDAVVACITGKLSPQQRGITSVPLEPTMATQNPELSSTNLLNGLDRTTQDVIGVIMNEQSLAGADAVGNIEIGGQTLHLSNPVSLPVLRKHKRGFLKLATQNNWLKVRTTENAKQLFVDYLGEHL